jgi:hypothetical protein
MRVTVLQLLAHQEQGLYTMRFTASTSSKLGDQYRGGAAQLC